MIAKVTVQLMSWLFVQLILACARLPQLGSSSEAEDGACFPIEDTRKTLCDAAAGNFAMHVVSRGASEQGQSLISRASACLLVTHR